MRKIIKDPKDFGKLVRVMRAKKYKTQLALAEEIGLTQATICRTESGVERVHMGTMLKILDGLGCRLVIETPEDDE